MRRRVNCYSTNNRPRPIAVETRLVVTALAERAGHLLLGQLGRGRFAGFWLLPTATVERGVEESVRTMLPSWSGYPVRTVELACVVEERRGGVMTLRFVFRAHLGAEAGAISEPDIAKVRWWPRDAVRALLTERDVVPNLSVMSLIRAWLDDVPLRPLEQLQEEALCPCGSGFLYAGCCGWDAR